MSSLNALLAALLLPAALGVSAVSADNGSPVSVTASGSAIDNRASNNNPRPQVGTRPVGCSQNDWFSGRCNPPQNQQPDRTNPPSRPYPPRPYPPGYYPPGYYPAEHDRTVVIERPAPMDDTPLTDDWEGCRKGKLQQIDATRNGNTGTARQMEEWLWKNCRNYSRDLRQLEQDAM